MSPEAVKYSCFSPACDVWALGVIAHQLCTLKLPFDDVSLKLLKIGILH